MRFSHPLRDPPWAHTLSITFFPRFTATSASPHLARSVCLYVLLDVCITSRLGWPRV